MSISIVSNDQLITIKDESSWGSLSERIQAVVQQRYIVHVTALEFDEHPELVYELMIIEGDNILLQEGLSSDEIFSGTLVLKEYYMCNSGVSELETEAQLFSRACAFIGEL